MIVESFFKKERENCDGSEIKDFLWEIIMHYLKVGTAIPSCFIIMVWGFFAQIKSKPAFWKDPWKVYGNIFNIRQILYPQDKCVYWSPVCLKDFKIIWSQQAILAQCLWPQYFFSRITPETFIFIYSFRMTPVSFYIYIYFSILTAALIPSQLDFVLGNSTNAVITFQWSKWSLPLYVTNGGS